MSEINKQKRKTLLEMIMEEDFDACKKDFFYHHVRIWNQSYKEYAANKLEDDGVQLTRGILDKIAKVEKGIYERMVLN